MVKLRLARKGRKKAPAYDIVAIDSRARRDGAYIERIGYMDPMTSPSTVSIDTQRAIYWMNVGAQPTDVVRALMSTEGVLLARHMQFKGASEEEIASAVETHKATAKARFARRKEARKVKRNTPKPAEGGAEAA
ncbi:MAG TPA: 30S ribosomal protein S16 [Patescibacteria group bacterium]|nr:30S ribosomal protein S16 [Patescibacteria group bacterium]